MQISKMLSVMLHFSKITNDAIFLIKLAQWEKPINILVQLGLSIKPGLMA